MTLGPGIYAELPLVETWRPVPGVRGYEVSDHGRVRSLDRKVFRTLTSGETLCAPRCHKGRVLAASAKAAGHLWVTLSPYGRFYIHRLVLEAFVGPAPPGAECCHYDDNPRNNKLSNLRWDTRSANMADFKRNYGYAQGKQPRC